MSRYLRSVAVAIGLVLATSTAWAQTPKPNDPKEVVARVVTIDRQQLTVELEDGTLLSATSQQQIEKIWPQGRVKALYVEDGSRKRIQSIKPVW